MAGVGGPGEDIRECVYGSLDRRWSHLRRAQVGQTPDSLAGQDLQNTRTRIYEIRSCSLIILCKTISVSAATHFRTGLGLQASSSVNFFTNILKYS